MVYKAVIDEDGYLVVEFGDDKPEWWKEGAEVKVEVELMGDRDNLDELDKALRKLPYVLDVNKEEIPGQWVVILNEDCDVNKASWEIFGVQDDYDYIVDIMPRTLSQLEHMVGHEVAIHTIVTQEEFDKNVAKYSIIGEIKELKEIADIEELEDKVVVSVLNGNALEDVSSKIEWLKSAYGLEELQVEIQNLADILPKEVVVESNEGDPVGHKLNTEYKPKGWNWEELAIIFGLVEDDKELETWLTSRHPMSLEGYDFEQEEKEYEERAKLVRDELNFWRTCNYNGYSEKDLHRAAKAVRKFVNKVAKSSFHTSQPLWKGLKKIDDDATFLNYVMILLEDLWT